MAIKGLTPYIHFDGSCEQAIRLYESALGAKAESVSRFSEAPGMNMPEDKKNQIMHAVLRLGPHTLMLSDGMQEKPTGSSIQVVLEYDDVAEMTKAFEALSAGGKVAQPLEDTFWGAKFGMLVDKFGVRWMMNCQLKQA